MRKRKKKGVWKKKITCREEKLIFAPLLINNCAISKSPLLQAQQKEVPPFCSKKKEDWERLVFFLKTFKKLKKKVYIC